MNLSLSRFLPTFVKKLGKPKSKPAPVKTASAPQVPSPAVPVPEPPAVTQPGKMLDEVAAFLARYLHCSQHQRNALALWVLHTHCFAAAGATPYLAIQSSHKTSGKTLCLRLLSLLCSNPALTSGYTAAALVHRIHSHPSGCPTFLLDESSATLGSRGRSKNPKLRAILASGFQEGIGYTDRAAERVIFSPKAFSILGTLPEALADRSLPIVLRPLREADHASISRFHSARARRQAEPLVAALQAWSKKNLSALKALPPYERKDFPAILTSRGQDMVEPLLQLADAIGGPWPTRARDAFVALFEDQERQQREVRIQLLRDIRDCFQHHVWPKALHTAVLLKWLHALPSRPWDVDGPITDRAVAKLLRPYGIRPRLVRANSVAHGYQQQEFAEPWNHILDADNQPKTTQQNQTGAQPPSAASSPKAGVEEPGSPTRATLGLARGGVQEIANKDASCNPVTLAQIDPRIVGILDDPRNFFRQYPESHKKGTRDIAVNSHHWPQPADDKGPADVLYTLNDGITIPYTLVNRDPWDPKGTPSYHNKRPRWPVLLSDEEKAQVATARFFELHAKALAQCNQQPAANSEK